MTIPLHFGTLDGDVRRPVVAALCTGRTARRWTADQAGVTCSRCLRRLAAKNRLSANPTVDELRSRGLWPFPAVANGGLPPVGSLK